MDAIFEPGWRIWPSIAAIAVGVCVLSRSVVHEARFWRTDARDMAKPLALASGLRLMLLGVSLVAFGFAWIFQVVWLWWLALIFGAEETWETSMIVSGLKQSDRFSASTRGTSPPSPLRRAERGVGTLSASRSPAPCAPSRRSLWWVLPPGRTPASC